MIFSTPRPSTTGFGSSSPGRVARQGSSEGFTALALRAPTRRAPHGAQCRPPPRGGATRGSARLLAGVSLPHSSGESGACRLSTLYAPGGQKATKTIELLASWPD